MATASSQIPLAERQDVHKSCKSLEILVNTLNDYCEAAIAIVTLQKKLVKALRETAGLKVTNEIAANAFNATANIFEVLSDIDNKFGKLADKECETVNTEVRKWFKKLSKEEKAHDERLNNANTRIKQAGQSYEKKAKKNARDTFEEHARYMNLIASLGPEISQERYNHALYVSQQQIGITYALAACASRIANAKWLRFCEGVRRFSPTVGQLGQWLALCESGWTGSVPSGLPDIAESASTVSVPGVPSRKEKDEEDVMQGDAVANTTERQLEPIATEAHNTTSNRPDKEKDTGLAPPATIPSPNSAVASTPNSTSRPQQLSNSSSNNTYNNSTAPSSVAHSPARKPVPVDPEPTPSNTDNPPKYPGPNPANDRLVAPAAAVGTQRGTMSDRDGTDPMSTLASITTLASFPSPPTHIPIPPSFTSSSIGAAQMTMPGSLGPPVSDDGVEPRRLAESPTPMHDYESHEREAQILAAKNNESEQPRSSSETHRSLPHPPSRPSTSVQRMDTIPTGNTTYTISEGVPIDTPSGAAPPPSLSTQQIRPHPQPRSLPPEQSRSVPLPMRRESGYTAPYGRGDYLPMDEFGALGELAGGQGKALDRMDSTGTNGSVIKGVRARYSTGAASPPPRDLPKLPISVSNLATRYQSGDTSGAPPPSPLLPRQGAHSPPVQRPRALSSSVSSSSHARGDPGAPTPSVIQRQRERELREREDELRARERMLAARAKEVELREREREVESRSRELERRRAAFERAEQQQQQPQAQAREQVAFPNSNASRPSTSVGDVPKYSYSATHLVPPSPTTQQNHPDHYSPQNSSYSHSQPSSPALDHAPSCGCETCSVSKYRTSSALAPSPHDLRPPEAPPALRPEKPRGWIRRLSMPVVGGAFKGGEGKGGGQRSSMVMEDGRLPPGLVGGMGPGMGISNKSATSLVGGRR